MPHFKAPLSPHDFLNPGAHAPLTPCRYWNCGVDEPKARVWNYEPKQELVMVGIAATGRRLPPVKGQQGDDIAGGARRV